MSSLTNLGIKSGVINEVNRKILINLKVKKGTINIPPKGKIKKVKLTNKPIWINPKVIHF